MKLNRRLCALEQRAEHIEDLALQRLSDDELERLIAWLDAPDAAADAPIRRFIEVRDEVAQGLTWPSKKL